MITELDIPHIELNNAITFIAVSHLELRPFLHKFNIRFDDYYLADFDGSMINSPYKAFANSITSAHCEIVEEYCKRKMGL